MRYHTTLMTNSQDSLIYSTLLGFLTVPLVLLTVAAMVTAL